MGNVVFPPVISHAEYIEQFLDATIQVQSTSVAKQTPRGHQIFSRVLKPDKPVGRFKNIFFYTFK